MELFYYLLIALGLNVAMFIPAYKFKTDKLTDLSYGLTFVILAVLVLFLNSITEAKIILTLMVIAWGLRLGGFLFLRVRKFKKDSRFDGMRESFFRFFRFWFLQGLTAWVVLVPALFFISSGGDSVLWAGFFIWLAGLIIEATADWQKYRFSQKKENQGRFIQEGLWNYSRHPNYFGEILCWVGVYIFVFPGLSGLEPLLALISPLFIISLLLFISGIPPLEKFADQKWGKEKAYQEYKKSTSILVPWFKKQGKK
ncbi:MAG: DUF1295 domain-containing protein [Candidatus Moranbacteria bacterium]|nr:DUF1295 domain-containing protein [Candidatus Moranbacteria bacterium]MDZ7611148.1 DUF1295 domain-containing protein [Candidatus Moranbacteria bacterium]MDZ7611424.1 DUF1295 domain-containing protein [Candidatus Moranbacteria bacterium]